MQDNSLIDHLHTLINFFPVSSNQQAVGALLDYAESRLRASGLVAERIEHGGINSLYASTRGQKHARVMLQAHIDVVPGGQAFRIVGDKIYGRGCYDMLFAAASFIALVENLDNPASYDISILLTGDEELGGANGVGAILDAERIAADVCILPDAGDQLGTLSIAAKGIYHFQVRANGISHHGSRPWEGDNAIHKLVAFLTDLQAEFDLSDHDNSTITISQLRAGSDAINQAPAEAYAGIDIRFSDQSEYERIKRAVDTLAVKYDVDVEGANVGRSFALDVDKPLVQKFVEIYKNEVGIPIAMTKAHGSSDARYFDDKSIPVIMFRPDGGNAHGDGEWLSISSWYKFHQTLKRYVLETTKV